MSKEKLSESTTCMRYIDPKLADVGWGAEYIIREYQITNGKIIPERRKSRRDDPLKADYVLLAAPNFKIAVVEAKAYDKPHDLGIQQAINYAEKMQLYFAYATNGQKIEEYDFITKQQKTIEKFPTPEELLNRVKSQINLDDEKMKTLLHPFNRKTQDPVGKPIESRYYQEIAVNAATQAILAGKKRILLTMATGTGKTFVAYQIAQRLWDMEKPHPKILFLADRSILIACWIPRS